MRSLLLLSVAAFLVNPVAASAQEMPTPRPKPTQEKPQDAPDQNADAAPEETLEDPEISGVTPLDLPQFPLGGAAFRGGHVVNLTIALGSGAYYSREAERLYVVTDRGPAVGCDDSEETLGVSENKMCDGDEDGVIFALPHFAPMVHSFIVKDDALELEYPIVLKGKKALATGLPVPTKRADSAWSPLGESLENDPNGFDPEAIVRLKDGSYYIAEEYGPSIAHIALDGEVKARWVPEGTEDAYKGADYPVKGVLPAILATRRGNRGLEGLAISPDEKTLYFATQAPLAHPDKDASKKSRTIRLYKMTLKDQKTEARFYQLDAPGDDATVKELVAVGPDRVMVLENTPDGAKLYRVTLGEVEPLNAEFDDPDAEPTLESLDAVALHEAEAVPLEKTLLLDIAALEDAPKKIEGVAVLDTKTVILTNDSDFGMEGAKSEALRVTFDGPVFY